MKSIHTLVDDIYEVIETTGGWDEAISKYCASNLEEVFNTRLANREERPASLRLSAMGTPCPRKLWYSINEPDGGETLPAHVRLKFLYGDILEELLISLAKAAGHNVEGCQDALEVDGIVGHRDCVIDGITVDVKSASSYSFSKFASGTLRENDSFGYISQLSSYVYAGRDHPTESHPSHGAFLVIDKVSGKICLDYHDLTADIETKLEDINRVRDTINDTETVPPRSFEPEPDGKSGNEKLPIFCSYCDKKFKCHPNLRVFAYSNGPTFLTKVSKLPRVQEVTQ